MEYKLIIPAGFVVKTAKIKGAKAVDYAEMVSRMVAGETAKDTTGKAAPKLVTLVLPEPRVKADGTLTASYWGSEVSATQAIAKLRKAAEALGRTVIASPVQKATGGTWNVYACLGAPEPEPEKS
jgi:hypothetical protein